MSKDLDVEPMSPAVSSRAGPPRRRGGSARRRHQADRAAAQAACQHRGLLRRHAAADDHLATSEYNNAGGWPTDGFSQSSSIPNVWNIWIIYPFMAWLFFIAVNVASVLVRKPISEDEIRQEMHRRSGT